MTGDILKDSAEIFANIQEKHQWCIIFRIILRQQIVPI